MTLTASSSSDDQFHSCSHFQLDPNWKPLAPHREDRGSVKVVWLQGTPYEMGYQHGQLLHDEIGSLPWWFITSLKIFAKHLGLARFAKRRSFPDIIEESEGLAAATADIGLTVESCLALALADVFQAFLRDTLPMLFNYKVDFHPWLPTLDLGCSQFFVARQATTNGQLYHGNNLDCPRHPIQYWLKHTTVFVRQPNQGIPHLSIAIPGAIWPNSGLNAAGISLAFNTAHPGRLREFSLNGRSHVQIMAQILKYASTYSEARTLLAAQSHMASGLIAVADGKSRQAGVFEITAQHTAIRELDEIGVLYVTNHFVAPTMKNRDQTPPRPSSVTRYDRFQQLLEPHGLHSRYGKIDSEEMMRILRDRINPYTLEESSLDTYDDNASIATNGAIRQVVFDPTNLCFWMATGEVPVSANPFMQFSLAELLHLPKPLVIH
ncbi:MAG TPA: C45 family peptidase [Cyanophyceae cyanobacterium]